MSFGAACLCVLFVSLVTSHPTIYKRNEDAVLSAVLVPVSSTVIPLPIYRVSTSVKQDGSFDKMDEASKLVTVKMKKSKKDKTGASVKAVTREDWEKSLIA